MKNSFSELLKQLRKADNLTQEDLANEIGFSRDTIKQVECGQRNPSLSLLNKLSYFFTMDLNKYYYAIENDQPIEVSKAFFEFKMYIETLELEKLKNAVEKYSRDDIFKYGIGLQLIYYGKSIAYFEDDSAESITLTKKALEISNIEAENLCSEDKVHSVTDYSLITNLCIMYFHSGDYNKSKRLTILLYNNLYNTFFKNEQYTIYSLPEINRSYILIINNLAAIEIKNNKYQEAYEHINYAIDFCFKNYNARIMYILYFTKFECEYFMNNFKEAAMTLEDTLVLLSFKSKKEIKNALDSIDTGYPKIISHIDLDRLRCRYS